MAEDFGVNKQFKGELSPEVQEAGIQDRAAEQSPLEKVKEQMGDQYAELTKALGYNETYDPGKVLQSYEDRKGRGEFRDTPDEELDVITDGIAKLREALK